MIDERTFLKKPINFKGKFDIYPPSIDEVLDEKNFNTFRNLLLITQEEIEDSIVGDPDNYLKLTGEEHFLTPFEYLITLSYQNEEIYGAALQGMKFFLHQDVTIMFDEKKILIGSLEKAIIEHRSLDNLIYIENDYEYFEFQNALRDALGEKRAVIPDPNMQPRLKRFKAKFRRTERIKAQKSGGMTFGTTLVAICCMGFGLNSLNIGQISYASARILFDAYQKKTKYEMDINSLLAGADPKKVKPVYWLEELNKD